MLSLKEKIMAEGVVLSDTILKVDSFLNHQIDPVLIMELGQEIARRFDGANINKVLTIEASGIAVALTTGLALQVPVVFAKKRKAVTQDPNSYGSEIFSFTKRETVTVYVSKAFLKPTDRVLVVDDFLARGDTLAGMQDIINQAGATLVGVGIVIEKTFQAGGQKLRAQGIPIKSLAAIASLADGVIRFID